MRCQDVANLLDEHAELNLTSAEKAEVDSHLALCDDCARAWRSGFILRSYRSMPTPGPKASLFAESIAKARGARTRHMPARSFWWGAGAGGALAAGLSLLVVFLTASSPNDSPGFTIPALSMTLDETRNVSVAIESDETLDDVQVRVLLVGGIRLERFEGRTSIDWRTGLDVGVNRLTLPVVALDNTGGEILVEVAHGEKSKFFVMHIDVTDKYYVKYMQPIRVVLV